MDSVGSNGWDVLMMVSKSTGDFAFATNIKALERWSGEPYMTLYRTITETETKMVETEKYYIYKGNIKKGKQRFKVKSKIEDFDDFFKTIRHD